MDANPISDAITGALPAEIDDQLSVLAHVQNRLLHLSSQLDAVQAQLDRLVYDVRRDGDQVDALVQHLTNPQLTQLLQERLGEFTEQMNTQHEQLIFVARRLTELATQDQLVRLATMVASQEQLSQLAGTLDRLYRHQQKSNALGETREQQFESALATLQEIVLRREQLQEQQAARTQQQQEEMRRSARGELAADLLPALDGLELALDRGRALAARYRHDLAQWLHAHGEMRPDHRSHAAPSSLLQKLQHRLSTDPDAGATGSGLPDSVANAADTVETWLKGLALVRDRFLALLANEGIVPITTSRQVFDPRLHVAVKAETHADLSPNTIVREVRKGYRQDRRILRYAEVVIARAPEPGEESKLAGVEAG
jgi:molecular chaperone GrpE (heat shock protein)